MRTAALIGDRLRRAAHPRHLPLLIAGSVALRVAAASYLGGEVSELPGISDQLSYHLLAMRVADGSGFSFAEGHWPATPAGEPTAHWSYLYTLYLAAVYATAGVQPLVARLLQATVVGVLHPWLAFRIGHRLFGPVSGTLAAVFAGVYGYFVYYAGGLLTEAFYFVAILWTFDVATRLAAGRSTPPLRTWIELGVAIGVTALLRQVFLVFTPVLALWLCLVAPDPGSRWAWGRLRPRVRGVAVTALAAALLIAPWTIRNYRAFGQFVPLNTNAGFAFYWGNHPAHGSRFVPLFSGPTYATLIPAELRDLNEAALDRALLGRAFDEIARDPWRYVRLSITRVPEYFRFWPSPDSGLVSNAVRVLSFGLFLPLMLYGVVVTVGDGLRRERTGPPGASLLLLFAIVYTGIHLATWTLIRYRLPVDVVLLVVAAHGVARLIGHDQGGREAATVRTR